MVTANAGDLILAHRRSSTPAGPNASANVRHAVIPRLQHKDVVQNGYDAYTDIWRESGRACMRCSPLARNQVIRHSIYAGSCNPMNQSPIYPVVQSARFAIADPSLGATPVHATNYHRRLQLRDRRRSALASR